MGNYDMCVDYQTLCTIEDKLRKIEYNLNQSIDKMKGAIQKSQDFLAGQQFEKAKAVTMQCTELTIRTEMNIKYARDYIAKLRDVFDEYNACKYTGGYINESCRPVADKGE